MYLISLPSDRGGEDFYSQFLVLVHITSGKKQPGRKRALTRARLFRAALVYLKLQDHWVYRNTIFDTLLASILHLCVLIHPINWT